MKLLIPTTASGKVTSIKKNKTSNVPTALEGRFGHLFDNIPDSELDLLVGRYCTYMSNSKKELIGKITTVQRDYKGELILRVHGDFKRDPSQFGVPMEKENLTLLKGKPIEYWEPKDSTWQENVKVTEEIVSAIQEMYPDSRADISLSSKKDHRHTMVVRRYQIPHKKSPFILVDAWLLSNKTLNVKFMNQDYDYLELAGRNVTSVLKSPKTSRFLKKVFN